MSLFLKDNVFVGQGGQRTRTAPSERCRKLKIEVAFTVDVHLPLDRGAATYRNATVLEHVPILLVLARCGSLKHTDEKEHPQQAPTPAPAPVDIGDCFAYSAV